MDRILKYKIRKLLKRIKISNKVNNLNDHNKQIQYPVTLNKANESFRNNSNK